MDSSEFIQIVKNVYKLRDKDLFEVFVGQLIKYPKQLKTLSKHISKHINTFNNLELLKSLRHLYTRLQEEAVPDTTEYIFLVNDRITLIEKGRR